MAHAGRVLNQRVHIAQAGGKTEHFNIIPNGADPSTPPLIY